MKAKQFSIVLVLLVLLLTVFGCSQQQTPPAAPTGQAPTDLTNKVNTLQQEMDVQKKSINPGLGTVMIEYSNRFSRLWFAAQANNWDMAHYQILEMKEIQETGEVTRPARAQMLKGFENAYLGPLDAAIGKKDKTAFTTAYDKTIAGCNGCHAGSTSNDFKGGYKFVKVIRPSSPPAPDLDYAGQ